jgi:methionyl aminopeptidase
MPAVPPDEIPDRMRAAGRAAREVLLEVGAAVKAGVTTDELDRICHDAYIARGGYPSTLDYKGYPKSLCTSVNEIICHGIPDDRPLSDGEIVNCDVTIYLHGVHGDCSETFLVGDVDPIGRHLVATTYECLWKGIDAVKPGSHIYEIGRAIQTHAEENGFSVVRAFVGHGVGEIFHTSPSVPHFYDPHSDTVIEQGMTFTIEPMINAGKREIKEDAKGGQYDGWTIVTRDHSLSAQWEHTVLVTETGYEVLTLSAGSPPVPAFVSAAA